MIFHKQPGAFYFFCGHLLLTLWDWNNPIWKYFVHDHHSSFSRNGLYKHYMPSCCFQGKLTKDSRLSTSYLTSDLCFSPHSVVCFHLRLYWPFFSFFFSGIAPAVNFKPNIGNGFNILSIGTIPDIRSSRNECFSGPNRFLPDLSVGPTCLGISLKRNLSRNMDYSLKKIRTEIQDGWHHMTEFKYLSTYGENV